MDIFCVKCKKVTLTKGEKVVTKDNRSRVTGTCSICGTRKNRFVKKN